jgi:predicted DNA-binding transcriptional regulator
LDNTITSIKSQLDLYKSLKELAEDMPEDRAIQEQLRISRMEIRNNVVLLQKTGFSMVDLLGKFGTELFKS